MNLSVWDKRPTHFSGCFSKETPWGSAKCVSSREFLQTAWRVDDRWMRLGHHVLGDDATPDAESKPAEHEPKARTGRVGLGHTTTPVREGQQERGKDQEFEESEDAHSQAQEADDSLPKACQSGQRGQQRNEDREQK